MKIFKAILSKGDTLYTTAENILDATNKLYNYAVERGERVLLVTEETHSTLVGVGRSELV